MATKIEWTHGTGFIGETWNPVVGCTYASEGCRFCYAATMTRRLEAMGQKDYAGLTTKKHFNGTVRLLGHKLDKPLRWRKPRMVFVNSMSDLFHKDVPFEFIDKVFAVMALCPQHTFQVLTKRPERMAEYLAGSRTYCGDSVSLQFNLAVRAGNMCEDGDTAADMVHTADWPLPQIWLGTSVEDQQRADERIPHLLRCPAAVRFLSVEPLLGPVNLGRAWEVAMESEGWSFHGTWEGRLNECPNCVAGENQDDNGYNCSRCYGTCMAHGIDWVIVGGESGPGARPCDLSWLRLIVEECKLASVPVFVKQLGANCVVDRNDDVGGGIHCLLRKKLRDKKGGNISEWPENLRVREFPGARGLVTGDYRDGEWLEKNI